MKKGLLIAIVLVALAVLAGVVFAVRANFFHKITMTAPTPAAIPPTPTPTPVSYISLRSEVVGKYSTEIPKEWSETATGVKTRFKTDQKKIALTFDACGGPGGSSYDKKLLDFLIADKVPATLFINSRWVDANNETFKNLAGNYLFEIANHGAQHLPCSVTGNSAYGIKGTTDIAGAFDEIQQGAQKIKEESGFAAKFYRAGTAFTDEVCPKIAWDLGENVVNYSVLGDAGGTYSAEKVKSQILSAEPGSIVLLHMNQPASGTSASVIAAVDELKSKGFEFVKLSDVELE